MWLVRVRDGQSGCSILDHCGVREKQTNHDMSAFRAKNDVFQSNVKKSGQVGERDL